MCSCICKIFTGNTTQRYSQHAVQHGIHLSRNRRPTASEINKTSITMPLYMYINFGCFEVLRYEDHKQRVKNAKIQQRETQHNNGKHETPREEQHKTQTKRENMKPNRKVRKKNPNQESAGHGVSVRVPVGGLRNASAKGTGCFPNLGILRCIMSPRLSLAFEPIIDRV